MKKEIIFNSTPGGEVRVAIIEDGRLAELFVETPEKARSVGDIFLGRVVKVMPGLRAAFVDLGLEQDAFLHFSDIGSSLKEFSDMIGDDDEEEPAATPASRESRPSRPNRPAEGKPNGSNERPSATPRAPRPEQRPQASASPVETTASAGDEATEPTPPKSRATRPTRAPRRPSAALEAAADDQSVVPTYEDLTTPVETSAEPLMIEQTEPETDAAPDDSADDGAADDGAGEETEGVRRTRRRRGGRRRGKRSETSGEISGESGADSEAGDSGSGADSEAGDSGSASAEPSVDGSSGPSAESRRIEARERHDPQSDAPAERRAPAAAADAMADTVADTVGDRPSGGPAGGRRDHGHRSGGSWQQHGSQLERGQEILVQIIKEPISTKGPRVTSDISLAGRFLVLMPFDEHIAVSKKIQSFKEKRRLKSLAQEILPAGFGVIIRTVAEGKATEDFQNDLRQLLATWSEIEANLKSATAPALVSKDVSMASSVIRDVLSDDVVRVVVDDKQLYNDIRTYVAWAAPNLMNAIQLYKGREPVFEAVGIERDVESVYSRKVWLNTGGSLIIEQTEAMVVVDVNSGRFVGKRDHELNALRTNLEAAREVARQLRLRDLGGIIVVDFIDLQDERNRKKVYDDLRKEFRLDRAKTNVLPMSDFGVVQITRQRVRPALIQRMSESCPTCGGTGLVQSKSTTARQIERWLKEFRAGSKERRLELRVNPALYDLITEGRFNQALKWMVRFFVHLKIESDPEVRVDDFRFLSIRRGEDITGEFTPRSQPVLVD